MGAAWHRGSIFAFHSAAPGLNLGIPKNKIFDVAEIYQQRCFEERGQMLENVDQTHPELASNTKRKKKGKSVAAIK